MDAVKQRSGNALWGLDQRGLRIGQRGLLLLIVLTMIVSSFPNRSQAQASTVAGPAQTDNLAAGKFVNVTGKLGIHFKQEASPTSKKYLLSTMGSGVALFDYDNDGRLDIFLANGARIDDPTAKGTIPPKDGPKYLEPSLSPKGRRRI